MKNHLAEHVKNSDMIHQMEKTKKLCVLKGVNVEWI